MRRMSCLLLVMTQLACAARRPAPPPPAPPKPTCVVLSVGGSSGLAHLGALDALRERQVPVDCVVGNSMGAVVGSLYATSPDADLKERYRAFVGAYREKSEADFASRGVAGAVAGAGVGLLLGPVGWLALIGAGLGAATTPEVSIKRFAVVLNEFYDGANIEQTAVPFVTFYQQRRGQGIEPVRASSGNLARAVAASAANPFIFSDVRVSGSQPLDPGTDRVSAIPVQDACDAFPGYRLIVINVTGRSSFYARDLPCEVHEIRVDDPFTSQQTSEEDDEEEGEPSPEKQAMTGYGDAFEAVYQAGYAAVMAQPSL